MGHGLAGAPVAELIGFVAFLMLVAGLAVARGGVDHLFLAVVPSGFLCRHFGDLFHTLAVVAGISLKAFVAEVAIGVRGGLDAPKTHTAETRVAFIVELAVYAGRGGNVDIVVSVAYAGFFLSSLRAVGAGVFGTGIVGEVVVEARGGFDLADALAGAEDAEFVFFVAFLVLVAGLAIRGGRRGVLGIGASLILDTFGGFWGGWEFGFAEIDGAFNGSLERFLGMERAGGCE